MYLQYHHLMSGLIIMHDVINYEYLTPGRTHSISNRRLAPVSAVVPFMS